jgi:hypothetical protein
VIQTFSGRLARDISRQVKTLPVQPGFAPTHLIVVDQATYLNALDARLVNEGRTRPSGEHEIVDMRGIARQVLISLTLVGRSTWQIGGSFSSGGYSHAQTQSVSELLRWSAPTGWFSDITPVALRTTTCQLDRYYRTGTWWVDRLSVALGYLWSALTTTHAELAFAALCMALEAIATNANTEVTHILAERCSLLARKRMVERRDIYAEIKALYGLRSKIVHGRSAPRKGPITWETLSVTAKQSMVPVHRSSACS